MGGDQVPISLGRWSEWLPRLIPRDFSFTPLNDFRYFSTFRIDGSKFAVGSMSGIDLLSQPRPGAPPGKAADAASRMTLRIEQPVLYLDTRNWSLKGSGVLSIPSEYPEWIKAPTKVDVNFHSTKLDLSLSPSLSTEGNARYGPLNTEFSLKLHYDAKRVFSAFSPTAGKSGVLNNLGDELAHPGIDVSAVVRLATISIAKFSLTAPTTKSLLHPLPGAFTSFPSSWTAYGVIPTPAGSLFDVPALGVGYTSSKFDEKSGQSFTIAALPTLSVSAINAGESFARKFPVYGYLEYYKALHVSDNLDLGIRLTLSGSTADLATAGKSPTSKPLYQQYLESKYNPALPESSDNVKPDFGKPQFMFRLEGRFNLP